AKVIARAMAKDREARTPDAKELARDLDAFMKSTGAITKLEQVADFMDQLFPKDALERTVARQVGMPQQEQVFDFNPNPEPAPARPHGGSCRGSPLRRSSPLRPKRPPSPPLPRPAKSRRPRRPRPRPPPRPRRRPPRRTSDRRLTWARAGRYRSRLSWEAPHA